jgi:Subtilase family
MSDTNPAATAEHLRRRRTIRRNPYVLEMEPGVFVAGHQIVVLGAHDLTGLTDVGFRPLIDESGDPDDEGKKPEHGKTGLTRQDALAYLSKSLNITFYEREPESDPKAHIERIEGLRIRGLRVDVVPVLTLAPWDTGPAGPPSVSSATPSKTRQEIAGSHRATVAVLDSGMPTAQQLTDWHDSNDVTGHINDLDAPDPLYTSAGLPDLDEAAAPGHGLFVATVVTRNTSENVTVNSYRTTEFILSTVATPDPNDNKATMIGTVEIVADLLRAHLTAGPDVRLIYNLSFGGYVLDNANNPSPENIDFVHCVMSHIAKQREGTVFCAAAGNKAYFEPGVGNPDYNEGTREIFPAAYCLNAELCDNVISVGALDPSTATIAGFSGRGNWVRVWTTGAWIEGEYVEGEWSNPVVGVAPFPSQSPIATWSGTSFATPKVAASIATQCERTNQLPTQAWGSIVADRQLVGGLSWWGEFGLAIEAGVILP